MIIVKTFTCLSDVRIRKILTLLKKSHKKIIFSGGIFPKVNAEEFKLSNVRYNYKLRNNSRSGILSLTLLNFRDIVNLKKGDIFYVVDEPPAILLIPVLLWLKLKKVNLIIDLFDSLYLKFNKNILITLLCKLIFKLFDSILVTDQKRYEEMNSIVQDSKLVIIENFPFYKKRKVYQKPPKIINLFFYGLLQNSRGWFFIRQFFDNSKFKIYLAGRDRLDFDLKNLPDNFELLDLMTPEETLDFMNKKIHWIFCLYEPTNRNNILASPNKVYDAIHSNCGIITNSELYISSKIKKENWGIVISEYEADLIDYENDLINKKDNFFYSENFKRSYSFDQYKNFYSKFKLNNNK